MLIYIHLLCPVIQYICHTIKVNKAVQSTAFLNTITIVIPLGSIVVETCEYYN